MKYDEYFNEMAVLSLRNTLSIKNDYFDKYTEYLNKMVLLILTNTPSISNEVAIMSHANTLNI